MAKDKKIDFDKLFKALVNNVTMYPAIAEALAEELSVTVESLNKLGVGFHFKYQAWAFAERDAKGNITGISLRPFKGKKFMVPGSKHGLFYVVGDNNATEQYRSGAHNWTRVTKDLLCPVCDKDNGCAVASSNPTNPPAVMCVHQPQGSVKQVGLGFLHILKPEGIINQQTVLEASKHPILVVEGASDVLAAMDLGFVGIGRPNDVSCMDLLVKMPLHGKEVWIIGENDSGAGQEGMQRAFANISTVTNKALMFLPVEGTKDLRKWVQGGLTQNALYEYAKEYGSIEQDSDVFKSDDPIKIGDRFLKDEYTRDGNLLLREYKGVWYYFNGTVYREILDQKLFDGRIFKYLEDKKFIQLSPKGDINIKPYKASTSKVRDIVRSLYKSNDIDKGCIIKDMEAPCWLDDRKSPRPEDLLTFKNGVLDVAEYIKGKVVLHKHDPKFFTFNVFPYDFDENAESPLFKQFLNQIFETDLIRIDLLAQWLGYNLVPDMSLDALMLLHGKSRAGKGTILGILENTLGRDQCAAINYDTLTSSFGLSCLVGKLAATLGDVVATKHGDEAAVLEMIKRLTGGDAVRIDRKHISALENVHLKTRFTMGMNNLPVFSDNSGAWLDRIKILHFDKSFAGKEDPTLRIRLVEEAGQGKMINFALRGLKNLREHNKFIVPNSSRPILNSLSEISKPIVTFIEDCCELGKDHVTQKQILFDVWSAWCKRNHIRYGSAALFGRELLAAEGTVEAVRPRDEKGMRIPGYKGIKPTDDAISMYVAT